MRFDASQSSPRHCREPRVAENCSETSRSHWSEPISRLARSTFAQGFKQERRAMRHDSSGSMRP